MCYTIYMIRDTDIFTRWVSIAYKSDKTPSTRVRVPPVSFLLSGSSNWEGPGMCTYPSNAGSNPAPLILMEGVI